MFGFLKPRCRDVKYRQVYAAICSYQRQTFGVPASIFISYEAVFLYHLAIDAEVTGSPAACTPTCCRLRNDWANNWELDLELAEFCVSFAVLLSQIKIEDDIRDSGSLAAHAGNWILKKAFRKSQNYFEHLQPGFGKHVNEIIGQHLRLELTDLEKSPDSNSPEGYSEPTGEAFGFVFGMFGRLCDSRKATSTSLELAFQRIGEGVGRGILTSDCLFDARRDLKAREFNPVRNTDQAKEMKTAALKILAGTGWLCDELVTKNTGEPARMRSSEILRYAFDRVSKFEALLPETKTGSKNPNNPLAKLRFGACDCIGEVCCGAMAEGAGGCCIEGACGACAEGGSGLLACDACLCCPAECCVGDCNEKRKTQAKGSAQEIKIVAPLVGSVGVAKSSLNPSGYVTINGKEHPAKSQGNWIEKGEIVVVIEEGGFGLVVERKGE